MPGKHFKANTTVVILRLSELAAIQPVAPTSISGIVNGSHSPEGWGAEAGDSQTWISSVVGGLGSLVRVSVVCAWTEGKAYLHTGEKETLQAL